MAYKMKGFSGFGNSPVKQMKSNKPPTSLNTQGSEGIPKGQNFERYGKDKYQSSKQKFDARQASKQKAKDFVKNLKTKGDLVSKKPTSTLGRVTQALKDTPKL